MSSNTRNQILSFTGLHPGLHLLKRSPIRTSAEVVAAMNGVPKSRRQRAGHDRLPFHADLLNASSALLSPVIVARLRADGVIQSRESKVRHIKSAELCDRSV